MKMASFTLLLLSMMSFANAQTKGKIVEGVLKSAGKTIQQTLANKQRSPEENEKIVKEHLDKAEFERHNKYFADIMDRTIVTPSLTGDEIKFNKTKCATGETYEATAYFSRGGKVSRSNPTWVFRDDDWCKMKVQQDFADGGFPTGSTYRLSSPKIDYTKDRIAYTIEWTVLISSPLKISGDTKKDIEANSDYHEASGTLKCTVQTTDYGLRIGDVYDMLGVVDHKQVKEIHFTDMP